MSLSSLFTLLLLSSAVSSGLAASSRPITEINPSDEYSKNCEGKHTDQHHYCWTFNQGNLLDNTWVQMIDGDTASPDNFYLKTDKQYKDFTVANIRNRFALIFREGSMIMYYNGLDKDGCYTVTVEAEKGHDLGIKSDDGREADTAAVGRNTAPGRRVKTSPPICSKWAQIYVS